MADKRSELYQPLHKRHVQDEAVRVHSAERALGVLFSRFLPGSVLDVGCGVGIWLAAAERLGAKEVRGIEGPWVQDAQLRTAPSNLTVCDLEQGFDLGRRFDLVTSIEVAEHLSPDAAGGFVQALTRH